MGKTKESIYDYVTDDLREIFNDVCLREMGLDLTKEDLVYDIESNTVLQFDGLYLKYCPSKYTIINQSIETRFNLIENPKLMTMLASMYCTKELNKKGYKVLGLNQYIVNQQKYLGYVALSIERINPAVMYNGQVAGRIVMQDIQSDSFINESVRLLSLVCKVNGTSDMYDLSALDVR